MSKLVKKGKTEKTCVAPSGSRQAVEEAIDASKGPRERTWESGAEKSTIPAWKEKRAECDKDE